MSLCVCVCGRGPAHCPGASLVCKEECVHPRPHPSLPDPSQPHQVLSDEHAREMCLRFADMECKLGEIDRARAIYSFCSQICDPRVGTVLSLGRDWGMEGCGQADQLTFLLPPLQTTGAFWQTWKDFEVRHGNEDTIREMLRIRRSVQATYNTQVNFMASQMLKVSGSATGTGEQALAVGAGLPGLRASRFTLSPMLRAGNSLGDRGLRLTLGAPSSTQSKPGMVHTASDLPFPAPTPSVRPGPRAERYG